MPEVPDAQPPPLNPEEEVDLMLKASHDVREQARRVRKDARTLLEGGTVRRAEEQVREATLIPTLP